MDNDSETITADHLVNILILYTQRIIIMASFCITLGSPSRHTFHSPCQKQQLGRRTNQPHTSSHHFALLFLGISIPRPPIHLSLAIILPNDDDDDVEDREEHKEPLGLRCISQLMGYYDTTMNGNNSQNNNKVAMGGPALFIKLHRFMSSTTSEAIACVPVSQFSINQEQ